MSKFVDQMSITDESGNIKKEININFGDPLAREQSQKAMRDSEQAKQTANEAKQIAQEAKDAVPGQVSQQVEEATRELSGQIGEAKQTANEAKQTAGINSTRIDKGENDISELSEFVKILLPVSPYGIVYKKSDLSPIEVTETGLADNIDLVSQGNFEYIYKCDCTGLSDLRNIFVDVGTYGENRITKKITLNNGAIDGAGLSYLVYKLRTLTSLDFVNVDTSNVTNLTCAFALTHCEKLDLSKLNFSRVQSFSYAFSDNSQMKELTLPSGMSEGKTIDAVGAFSRIGCKTLILDFAPTAKAGNMENMFYDADVENLQILNISFEDVTNTQSMLYACNLLITFSGLYRVKKSYSLFNCTSLSHESALNCIAGLYDLTEGGTVTDYTAQTLTFYRNVREQLTEEEIAEATAKGWNIA